MHVVLSTSSTWRSPVDARPALDPGMRRDRVADAVGLSGVEERDVHPALGVRARRCRGCRSGRRPRAPSRSRGAAARSRRSPRSSRRSSPRRAATRWACATRCRPARRRTTSCPPSTARPRARATADERAASSAAPAKPRTAGAFRRGVPSPTTLGSAGSSERQRHAMRRQRRRSMERVRRRRDTVRTRSRSRSAQGRRRPRQPLKFGLKMKPTIPPSGFVTSAVTMPAADVRGRGVRSVAPALIASSTAAATSSTPQ